MNCIQKMLAAALGCVLSALLLTGCGEKEEPVNITLAITAVTASHLSASRPRPAMNGTRSLSTVSSRAEK